MNLAMLDHAPRYGELQLTEFAAELERLQDAKVDYVADTRRMQYAVAMGDPSPIELLLDGDSADELRAFTLTDHAHNQVAQRLKVPKSYYDRMLAAAPELLARNVNHWLREEPETRMLRTYEFTDGIGQLRAYVSNRYRRLDNIDLAEHVLPILGDLPDVEIMSTGLTEKHMYLKATLPRITADIRPGDTVQAGVMIRNSEVGAGALFVAPFIVRLVCTNGMTVTQWGQRHFHIGRRIEVDDEEAYAIYSDRTLELDDRALFAKVADLVRAACSEAQFTQIVDSLRELASTKVPGDPVAAVEKLAKKHLLRDGERTSVLTHLVEGGDLSRWGYVNAVTAMARERTDYDRKAEMETLGGVLVAQPSDAWRALVAA